MKRARVLVLGGTRFLGRHLVLASLARGHEVTLFHRGRSDPDAFAEPDAFGNTVQHVIGDRDVTEDLHALAKRDFDIVFDTSGYEVLAVKRAAQALARPGAHYAFVSSISVYERPSGTVTEDAPTRTTPDADQATLTLENYGALKAACEAALLSLVPGAQCIRAGLILGPHDYDERFAYWLNRIAEAGPGERGEVLAPGDPHRPAQVIDVRDLAAWMLESAERRRSGIFNATGPAGPLTVGDVLETIRHVVGSRARFTWVPDGILTEDGVMPYAELPFWLPEEHAGARFDSTRAQAAGLTFRPFAETVRDTWAWVQTGWDTAARARAERRLKIPAGISREREARLLARSTSERRGPRPD